VDTERVGGASPHDDSIDLLRRGQLGDTGAWDDLYLRYRDRLLLSIRCRLGPALRARLESEDILQSVFKDVLKDLESFAPQHGAALNHFLHTCVLNKIRNKADYFGARKRSGEVPLSDSLIAALPNAPEQVPQYHDAPRYAALESALARLPDEMREIVLLRRVEGLSNREVADLLGRSPEAASKAYNRALARLASLIGGSA